MQARYWRLIGFKTVGDLSLTHLELYSLGVRVDVSATLSSTLPPASGTLPGPVTFSAETASRPGFAMEWDLGTPATVDRVATNSDAFLGAVLQYRDSTSSTWVNESPIEATLVGGVPTLPLNISDNLWPIYFEVARGFNNAPPYTTTYAALNRQTDRQVLVFPYGERMARNLSGAGANLPEAISPVNTAKTLRFEVHTTQTSAQHAGALIEFLDSTGSPVAALQAKYVGGPKVVSYGPDANTLTAVGSYTRGIVANITFASDGVVITPVITTSGWMPTPLTIPSAALSITHVRCTPEESYNNWTGNPLCISTLYALPVPAIPARKEVHRGEQFSIDLNRGGAVYHGTVKEKGTPANTPLRRLVQLMTDRSGEIVDETWSDAATGEYVFQNLNPLERYTAISFDHTDIYQAVVADNLTPEKPK